MDADVDADVLTPRRRSAVGTSSPATVWSPVASSCRSEFSTPRSRRRRTSRRCSTSPSLASHRAELCSILTGSFPVITTTSEIGRKRRLYADEDDDVSTVKSMPALSCGYARSVSRGTSCLHTTRTSAPMRGRSSCPPRIRPSSTSLRGPPPPRRSSCSSWIRVKRRTPSRPLRTR